MTTSEAFEGETETVGVAVADPKAVDREFAESRTRPSVSGASFSGIGARPSPQRPASIRTMTSRVLGLP
jgi:hypothetical protein